MKTRIGLALVVGLALTLTWACVGLAGDEPGKTAPPKPSALDPFKALAGDWVAAGDAKSTVIDNFRVTAAGHSVVETIFPGAPHEMVTVYYLDGDKLLLTHYCSAGNQPTMTAKPGGDATKVAFEFTSGTNMKPEDGHMHSVVFTFVDKDHFTAEWTFFEGGKAKDTKKFEHVRKK